MAMLVVLVGFTFAVLLYYRREFDPNEAEEQFPGVHRFLTHKWYFDELYSAVLVRPGLVIAGWCRWFDATVIDGVAHFLSWLWVWISWLSGRIDAGVVDGLANLLAQVCYAVGAWLRTLQTGYLRSYVLFLVLAAVAIWIILSQFVGTAPAQP